MIGKHCIKAWSKTQSIIAKSSAESELYGVIKGSSEALGLATMARDFGVEMSVQVHVDATAAMGIVERRGISRVRHIECDNLWIQELEARRMLPKAKVPGGDNPADLMTKNVGIELAKKHMRAMGIRFEGGRTKAAAKLHHLEEKKDNWNVKTEGTQLNIMKIHEEPRKLSSPPVVKTSTQFTVEILRQSELPTALRPQARCSRLKTTGSDPEGRKEA